MNRCFAILQGSAYTDYRIAGASGSGMKLTEKRQATASSPMISIARRMTADFLLGVSGGRAHPAISVRSLLNEFVATLPIGYFIKSPGCLWRVVPAEGTSDAADSRNRHR
jgi:hypothetical protein